MIRLSKKIEYAILALQYIALHGDGQVSAKDISLKLGISFDFLSKTLQTLYKNGLLHSVQGIYGGYSLRKRPEDTSMEDVIIAIEGTKPTIVTCLTGHEIDNCPRESVCAMRESMLGMQETLRNVFRTMTIAELNKKLTLETFRVVN